jgi:hypothetical protein
VVDKELTLLGSVFKTFHAFCGDKVTYPLLDFCVTREFKIILLSVPGQGGFIFLAIPMKP